MLQKWVPNAKQPLSGARWPPRAKKAPKKEPEAKIWTSFLEAKTNQNRWKNDRNFQHFFGSTFWESLAPFWKHLGGMFSYVCSMLKSFCNSVGFDWRPCGIFLRGPILDAFVNPFWKSFETSLAVFRVSFFNNFAIVSWCIVGSVLIALCLIFGSFVNHCCLFRNF